MRGLCLGSCAAIVLLLGLFTAPAALAQDVCASAVDLEPATVLVQPEVLPEPQLLALPPDDDYILCSCSFCAANPAVECQVSPSGFSILCSDWYNWRC